MSRSNHSPEAIKLECGCNYNATHKRGDRKFTCRHGEWLIRHRTKTEHYYEVNFTHPRLFEIVKGGTV